MEKLVLGVKIKTWKSVYNKDKKNIAKERDGFQKHSEVLPRERQSI